MSLNDLAARAGLAPSAVYRIERGQHAAPRPDTLVRIAEALHVPVADLFTAAGYTTPEELPSFRVYLHARYGELPAPAQRELERHFMSIMRKHGPSNREDEDEQ